MGYIYLNNLGKLTKDDPYPLCLNREQHDYDPYQKEEKKSNFEEICKCGAARVFTGEFYSFTSMENYLSNGFKNFRDEALKIRSESGLVKKVEEPSLIEPIRQLYKSLFNH